MKQLTLFVMLLMLAGCADSTRDAYRMRPSVTERALSDKIMLDKPTAHNKADGINLTDTDVWTLGATVEIYWGNRQEGERLLAIIGAGARMGLETAANIVPSPGTGLLLSNISTMVGRALGIIKPEDRTRAHIDGLSLLGTAMGDYITARVTNNQDQSATNPLISGTKITVEGAALLTRVNAIVISVYKALDAGLPTLEELTAATKALPRTAPQPPRPQTGGTDANAPAPGSPTP